MLLWWAMVAAVVVVVAMVSRCRVGGGPCCVGDGVGKGGVVGGGQWLWWSCCGVVGRVVGCGVVVALRWSLVLSLFLQLVLENSSTLSSGFFCNVDKHVKLL